MSYKYKIADGHEDTIIIGARRLGPLTIESDALLENPLLTLVEEPKQQPVSTTPAPAPAPAPAQAQAPAAPALVPPNQQQIKPSEENEQ